MTPAQEERYGKLMAAMAWKEGHRACMPRTMAEVKAGMKYSSPLVELIAGFLEKNPEQTARQVAKGTGKHNDSVRASLNRMRKADIVGVEIIDKVMHFSLK